MRPSRFVPLLAAVLLCAAPARAASPWRPAPPSADTPEPVRAAILQADELYAQRDKPGFDRKALESARQLAAQHPGVYELQWRVARAAFWVSEAQTDKAARRTLAQEGWDAGQKALELRPRGAEALYFTSLCIGEYSHSVGILTALRQGLEAKFRDPMLLAGELDERVEDGGIWVALGRYKYELPWPKRDLDQSVEWLHRALRVFPGNLRAKVYLAESLHARDRGEDRAEARRVLNEVLRAPPGVYDAFSRGEELRARALAASAAKRLGWEKTE